MFTCSRCSLAKTTGSLSCIIIRCIITYVYAQKLDKKMRLGGVGDIELCARSGDDEFVKSGYYTYQFDVEMLMCMM